MKKDNPDISYEETQEYHNFNCVYEDSESPTNRVPFENDYEKRKWNSNGFDQSGMK